MTDESSARVVTSTGRPMVVQSVDWERVERALPDPAAREALARLGVGSGAVVPLVARGQTLGALGLFNREERGPLTAAESDTAIEIGLRAGLALHHARLFGQQRDLAEALQRSMLTDPPQPANAHIVVRYVPAAAGAEIGGDWYDAFLQRQGRRCSRSATSSATTPAPPPRWARCAACCAASATPTAAPPPRCSPSSTGPSRVWRWTRWPPRWSPGWSRTTTTGGRGGCSSAGRVRGTRRPRC